MLEYERLIKDEIIGHPFKVTVHQWNNYMSFMLNLTEKAFLTGTLYVQLRFDEFSDVGVLSSPAVRSIIRGSLRM